MVAEAQRPFPHAAPERDAIDRGHGVGGDGLDPERPLERLGDERDRGELVEAHGDRDRLRSQVPLALQRRGVDPRAHRPLPRRRADRRAVDEHLRVRARLITDPQPARLRDRLQLHVDRERLPPCEDELPLHGREAGLEDANDVRARRHPERRCERGSTAIAPIDADERAVVGAAHDERPDEPLHVAHLAVRKRVVGVGQIRKAEEALEHVQGFGVPVHHAQAERRVLRRRLRGIDPDRSRELGVCGVPGLVVRQLEAALEVRPRIGLARFVRRRLLRDGGGRRHGQPAEHGDGDRPSPAPADRHSIRSYSN